MFKKRKTPEPAVYVGDSPPENPKAGDIWASSSGITTHTVTSVTSSGTSTVSLNPARISGGYTAITKPVQPWATTPWVTTDRMWNQREGENWWEKYTTKEESVVRQDYLEWRVVGPSSGTGPQLGVWNQCCQCGRFTQNIPGHDDYHMRIQKQMLLFDEHEGLLCPDRPVTFVRHWVRQADPHQPYLVHGHNVQWSGEVWNNANRKAVTP